MLVGVSVVNRTEDCITTCSCEVHFQSPDQVLLQFSLASEYYQI